LFDHYNPKSDRISAFRHIRLIFADFLDGKASSAPSLVVDASSKLSSQVPTWKPANSVDLRGETAS
jgi:hypothetical protein